MDDTAYKFTRLIELKLIGGSLYAKIPADLTVIKPSDSVDVLEIEKSEESPDPLSGGARVVRFVAPVLGTHYGTQRRARAYGSKFVLIAIPSKMSARFKMAGDQVWTMGFGAYVYDLLREVERYGGFDRAGESSSDDRGSGRRETPAGAATVVGGEAVIRESSVRPDRRVGGDIRSDRVSSRDDSGSRSSERGISTPQAAAGEQVTQPDQLIAEDGENVGAVQAGAGIKSRADGFDEPPAVEIAAAESQSAGSEQVQSSGSGTDSAAAKNRGGSDIGAVSKGRRPAPDWAVGFDMKGAYTDDQNLAYFDLEGNKIRPLPDDPVHADGHARSISPEEKYLGVKSISLSDVESEPESAGTRTGSDTGSESRPRSGRVDAAKEWEPKIAFKGEKRRDDE